MSIVTDSVRAELIESIARSKEFADKIKTAKTKPKKDLYTKKLEKNNKTVANLIIALDNIEKA